jgi:thiol-disulfide isomerase/thioredoxin
MSSDLAPPEIEDPPPSPRRSRALPFLLAAVLGVVFVAVAIAVTSSNDDAARTADGGSLGADIPSLSDLAEEDVGTPQAAEEAPDFSVRTLDGGAFTLSRHLAEDGRPVVLNLWASWCFPCRAEMPAIDAFATAHPEIAVVGVSVQDDAVAAAEFAAEIGVGYVLGYDEKDEVNDAYRPLGLPATFLIAADGTIAQRHFGGVTEESLEADIAEFFGS